MAVHQLAYFCHWLKPLFWFRWCRLLAALMNGVFCSKFGHLKAIKVSFCPQIYSIYIGLGLLNISLGFLQASPSLNRATISPSSPPSSSFRIQARWSLRRCLPAITPRICCTFPQLRWWVTTTTTGGALSSHLLYINVDLRYQIFKNIVTESELFLLMVFKVFFFFF